MTIAVSVMVIPSRTLSRAFSGMLCFAILSAILTFSVNRALSVVLCLQISGIVTILVLCGIFVFRRSRKTFHIDISGIGQIRLKQYIGVSIPHQKSGMPLDGLSGNLVHLSPDSILWSQFILLRLKREQGDMISIPVLVDSVGASGFAQLSVACRWIAAQSASRKIIG